MKLAKAPDIKAEINQILKKTSFPHIKPEQVICFRSFEAKTRAYARIWSFPSIWQMALEMEPHYVIEVISERYDKLSEENKIRTLIHELLHIPKNFSGALRPHKAHKWRLSKMVDYHFELYQSKR